jgi:cytochrome c biogenesis protein CcmG/thiol:disulfide interchange protein DsbE
LVNLWATWCAPCRAEIPDLEAAYQAHGDDEFVVLGVNQGETRETIQPFVDEFDVTYPVQLDEQGELMKMYRGQGLPMSLLVDEDGVIQVRHVGYLTADQLDDYLAPLLP